MCVQNHQNFGELLLFLSQNYQKVPITFCCKKCRNYSRDNPLSINSHIWFLLFAQEVFSSIKVVFVLCSKKHGPLIAKMGVLLSRFILQSRSTTTTPTAYVCTSSSVVSKQSETTASSMTSSQPMSVQWKTPLISTHLLNKKDATGTQMFTTQKTVFGKKVAVRRREKVNFPNSAGRTPNKQF